MSSKGNAALETRPSRQFWSEGQHSQICQQTRLTQNGLGQINNKTVYIRNQLRKRVAFEKKKYKRLGPTLNSQRVGSDQRITITIHNGRIGLSCRQIQYLVHYRWCQRTCLSIQENHIQPENIIISLNNMRHKLDFFRQFRNSHKYQYNNEEKCDAIVAALDKRIV